MNDDVTTTALFVYDIRFESRRGGKEWRAVFEIRSDSNADGKGTSDDAAAKGVVIDVSFNGKIYKGTTDDRGEFRTTWETGLTSGSHYANVDSLMISGYDWKPLSLDLEDDSDKDGVPDDVLVIS